MAPFKDALIEFGGFIGLRGLFAADGLDKYVGDPGVVLLRREAQAFDAGGGLLAVEVEDELPGDGLHDGAGVTEEQARALRAVPASSSGLAVPGNGTHGGNASADAGGGKTHGTEVAQLPGSSPDRQSRNCRGGVTLPAPMPEAGGSGYGGYAEHPDGYIGSLFGCSETYRRSQLR